MKLGLLHLQRADKCICPTQCKKPEQISLSSGLCATEAASIFVPPKPKSICRSPPCAHICDAVIVEVGLWFSRWSECFSILFESPDHDRYHRQHWRKLPFPRRNPPPNRGGSSSSSHGPLDLVERRQGGQIPCASFPLSAPSGVETIRH